MYNQPYNPNQPRHQVQQGNQYGNYRNPQQLYRNQPQVRPQGHVQGQYRPVYSKQPIQNQRQPNPMMRNPMQQQQQRAPRVQLQKIPRKVPEVEGITDVKDIDALLSDGSKLDQFVSNSGFVRNITVKIQNLRDSNQKAKARVSVDSVQDKVKVMSQQDQKLKEMSNTISELNKKRGEIQQQYQPRFIVQKMDTLIRKDERDAKDITDNFIQGGGMTAREYAEKVMNIKTRAYVRQQKKNEFAQKFLK